MVKRILTVALAAGLVFAGGAKAGEGLTMANEFHTECFAMDWEVDGMYGEPVDCRTGAELSGEGVYLTHSLLMNYEQPIEGGDVARVSWTIQQAEQSDWETPANITLNGGER